MSETNKFTATKKKHVLETERLDTAAMAELRQTSALMRDAMAALAEFANRKRDEQRRRDAETAAAAAATSSAASSDDADDLPPASVMRVGPQRVSVPQPQTVQISTVHKTPQPQQAQMITVESAPKPQRATAQTIQVSNVPKPQQAVASRAIASNAEQTDNKSETDRSRTIETPSQVCLSRLSFFVLLFDANSNPPPPSSGCKRHRLFQQNA